MSNSLTRPRSLAYSATPLRSETAALLHEAGKRAVKMIAAALVVGRSRVDRMHAGEDANYLELLTRELDRIEIEEGRERILPILRWLCSRYGHGVHTSAAREVTREEIERRIGDSIRETSEAHVAALAAAPHGYSADEKQSVLAQIQEGIATLQALADNVQKSPEAPTH